MIHAKDLNDNTIIMFFFVGCFKFMHESTTIETSVPCQNLKYIINKASIRNYLCTCAQAK